MALSSYAWRVTSMLDLKTLNSLSTFSRHASGPSGRADCSKEPLPECSQEALAKTDCVKLNLSAAQKKDELKKKSPFWRLIVDESCCPPPCPEFPRFDDMYYKASDKLNHKYTRTWVECPECLFRPKKVCCPPPKGPLPAFRRRTREERPKTACPPKPSCIRKKPTVCPSFTLKGCKDARKPPTCKTYRPKADCKKRCAPYPSFSECVKAKFRIPRPGECLCLRMPTLCEIYAEMAKNKQRGKK